MLYWDAGLRWRVGRARPDYVSLMQSKLDSVLGLPQLLWLI